MVKKLLALVAAIILLGATPPAAAPKVEESILQVRWDAVIDGEPVGSRCTSFVVGVAWALTAEHCLPPNDKIDLYVDEHPTRVLKKDDAFALLSIEPAKYPILKFRNDRPPVGEVVTSYGYAYGDSALMELKRGVAAWCKCGFASSEHLILDAVIAPGMSGGPVLDSNGRIVGINQAATHEVGIACPSEELREFIK